MGVTWDDNSANGELKSDELDNALTRNRAFPVPAEQHFSMYLLEEYLLVWLVAILLSLAPRKMNSRKELAMLNSKMSTCLPQQFERPWSLVHF